MRTFRRIWHARRRYRESILKVSSRRSLDFSKHFKVITSRTGDRDSSVDIAPCYGMDGPGIESWCGRDFPRLLQPPATVGAGSFLGVGRPGSCVDHLPSSSAKVKERVELYLYSPSGPPWPVLWQTLTLSKRVKCVYNRGLSMCVSLQKKTMSLLWQIRL